MDEPSERGPQVADRRWLSQEEAMNASVKRPGLLWPSLIVLGAIGVASVASNSAVAGSPLCNERAVVLKSL